MIKMAKSAYVIGLGMTKFVKPGSIPNWDYPDMVKEAVTDALKDAKLQYTDVEQAVASFLYGESCSGQRALYPIGMTGIPIYNVNNACASGSSALNLARQIVESGNSDCVLAVGFEKMKPGSLDSMVMKNMDSVNPLDKHVQVISDTFGLEPSPITSQMFGNAGREHMQKYGTKPEHFAKIAWKNHKHSVHNHRSQFTKEYTMDEILNSKMIHTPLTKLQCCPTSDGAAAAILCSRKFLDERPHLRAQAVEILGMSMATDLPSAFNDNSNLKMIGFDASQKAARDLYKKTKLTPNDVQVIEVHDCFSANELITYEAIDLCPLGKAGNLIDRGDNTYGGKWVINPSGGLISKGHPIGATGIAQCAELCWQLRGLAGKRQVSNARIALQHNIGIGGAVVMAMYKLAFSPTVDQKIGKPVEKVLGVSFKSDKIFEKLQQNANQYGNSLVKEIGSAFKFIVSSGTIVKNWLCDFSKEPIFIGQKDGDAQCIITVSDEDLFNITEGKAKVEQLFLSGKLKIKGRMTDAFKLRKVFDSAKVQSKL